MVATAELSIAQEPLFNSAHSALVFAFNFKGDYDRPLMNRMSDKPYRGGKGLVGLDGSAQAGMIRGEVAELGSPGRWVLQARFAPRAIPCHCGASCCTGEKPSPDWREAIDKLQQWAIGACLSGCLTHHRLRTGLVAKHFGAKVVVGDLASQCGVNRDTASDHNGRIKQALKAEEGRAWRRISERLVAVGMVERE